MTEAEKRAADIEVAELEKRTGIREAMEEDEAEILRLEKKLNLGKSQSRSNFKKHMIQDNLGDMFDFLDNMNTDTIYSSMILRDEAKVKKDFSGSGKKPEVAIEASPAPDLDSAEKGAGSEEVSGEDGQDFFLEEGKEPEPSSGQDNLGEAEKTKSKPVKYEWKPKKDIYGQLAGPGPSAKPMSELFSDYKTHEDYALVRKQLLSLMNKLSEQNFERIISDIVRRRT